MFVQISYSVSCPNGSDCSFELQLRFDGHSVALQNNRLQQNIPIHSIQFTASPNNFDQFKLSIVAHPSSDGCIEVNHVLVFRNECPSQQSNGGLGLLPATQAPTTGSVSVTPQCVENSALSPMTTAQVQCTSDGTWVNDETLWQCVCNEGYYNDNGVCRGNTTIYIHCNSSHYHVYYTAVVNPEKMVYHVSEDKDRVEVCFIQEIVTDLTFEITTRDVTAISEWILFYCLIYSTI